MTWEALQGSGASLASSVQFEEALSFLLSRVVVDRPTQEAIEAGAAAESFWISDVSLLSVVSDVYESINDAVATGESFGSWREAVIDTLEESFPEEMTEAQVDARVDLIFRNNVQRAYNEGRYEQAQNPVILEAKPYFMYDAILDLRTTKGCRAIDGIIRPQGDPFWDVNYPPRHHNCRGGVRVLSQTQVDRRGGASVVVPDQQGAAGFGGRPGSSPDPRPNPDRYPEPINQALQERATERGAS